MYGCNAIMNSIIACLSFPLSSLSWFWCKQSPPIDSRHHYWFKKGLHRSYLLQATHLSHPLAQFSWIYHLFPKVQWSSILSCCFCPCHHLGELILKNVKDEFHWQKMIKHGSLIFGVDHISYCLPYHKTDHFYHSTTVLFSPQEVADPVDLLQSFVGHHDPIHGAQTALFLCEDGSFPNCVWFDKRFFVLLDHYFGGHSLYAEGATYFSSLSLSENVIQALGHWSSQAWTIYICDNPTIHTELQLACLCLWH